MIDIKSIDLYTQTEDDKAMQVRRGLLTQCIYGKISVQDITITEECLRSMRESDNTYGKPPLGSMPRFDWERNGRGS